MVADGGRQWQLLVMVVMWWDWLVFYDGGGSWSLWPFVAIYVCGRSLFVAVGGHCGCHCIHCVGGCCWSSCMLMVVVRRAVITKHCLLFITNK